MKKIKNVSRVEEMEKFFRECFLLFDGEGSRRLFMSRCLVIAQRGRERRRAKRLSFKTDLMSISGAKLSNSASLSIRKCFPFAQGMELKWNAYVTVRKKNHPRIPCAPFSWRYNVI